MNSDKILKIEYGVKDGVRHSINHVCSDVRTCMWDFSGNDVRVNIMDIVWRDVCDRVWNRLGVFVKDKCRSYEF